MKILLSVVVFVCISRGLAQSDSQDLAQRLSIAIDALEKSQRENTRLLNQQPIPIIQNGLESTYCLIECIQTMQNQEGLIQLPSVQDVDRNFGAWIDGPYNVFLFQAMCGTYVHHKQCLINCPDSAAKTMTLEAFEPLDFSCIHHYNDFIKHLPCFMALKPKLELTCALECGSPEAITMQVSLIQSQPDTHADIVQQTLSTLCRFSDCQRRCYEPNVLRTCGHDASSLIHHFTVQSAHELIKQLQKAGQKEFPEICDNLATAPEFSLADNLRGTENGAETETPEKPKPSRLLIFDARKSEAEELTTTGKPTLAANNSTEKVEKIGKLKNTPFAHITGIGKIENTPETHVPTLITPEERKPNSKEQKQKKHDDKVFLILMTIVLSLLSGMIVIMILITAIGRTSNCVGSQSDYFDIKNSRAKKLWISMQGFVTPKSYPPAADVVAF